MIVNNWLLVTLTIIATIHSFNYKNSITEAYKHSRGIIKEENYAGDNLFEQNYINNQETGKKSNVESQKTLLDKDTSSLSSSSSSSSKSNSNNNNNNKYSNLEVVYGEEDDDANNLDSTTTTVTSKSTTPSTLISSTKSQANLNKNNNMENVEKIENILKRDQRTDRVFMHHSKFRNSEGLQHKSGSFFKNNNNDDYKLSDDDDDDDLFRELLANSKLFETEMKLKEIINSHAPIMSMESSEIPSNSRTLKQINKNINYKKPVYYVQVKENLIKEKDYNKDLKDPKDVFSDLDLKIQPEESKQESSAVSSQPSLAKAQKNNVDLTLNAKIDQLKQQNDYLFIFVVAGCTIAGVVALVAAGVCWYTVHRNSREASASAEYGVKTGKFNSGSIKSNLSNSSGDRRLAQSAQMYHYQHQKQQMIAMEKANNDTKPDNSDNSEGETEEGDYTVYECPGLAPTGEMEVKNPLFKEDFSSPSVASMPPAYSTLTPAQSESANSQETTSKQTQESQQQQPTKPTDSNEQPSTSNINEVADFLSASGNKN